MNTEPHLVFMRNKKHFTINVSGPEVVSTDCRKQPMLKQAQHCVSKVKVACFDKQGVLPCLSKHPPSPSQQLFLMVFNKKQFAGVTSVNFGGDACHFYPHFAVAPGYCLPKINLLKRQTNESKFSLKKTVCVNYFAVSWAVVEFILKII
ncbi:unnamed protein product [Ixodes persulcatus]